MYPLALLGLGPGEIILLIIVLLIVFGAGKLPQIGKSLGQGLKNFRKGLKGEGEDEEKKGDKSPKAPDSPFDTLCKIINNSYQTIE